MVERSFAAPGFVAASRGRIVDGAGQPLKLRGVNLGFWLLWESYAIRLYGIESESRIKKALVDKLGKDEAYGIFRSWRLNWITRDDIQRIKALGFNHVRIPFNSRILGDEPHFDMAPGEGWVLLDQVLSWCEEAGLYAVLDMHSAPGGQNSGGISDNDLKAGLWTGPDQEENRKKTIDLWVKIASRYKDRKSVAALDLLNEPVLENGVDKAELARLYERLIKAVRAVDGNHMLMLEGNWYATDFSMFEGPAPDSNMAWHFHKYQFNSKPSETGRRNIQYLLDMRQRTGAPLYLGETGENSPRWYAWCLQLMEENDIGWCIWPWKRMGPGCPMGMARPSSMEGIGELMTAQGPLDQGRKERLARAWMDLVESMKIKNCREDQATLDAFRGIYEATVRVPGLLRGADYLRGQSPRSANSGTVYRPGDLEIQDLGGDRFGLVLGEKARAEWNIELSSADQMDTIFRLSSSQGARGVLNFSGEKILSLPFAVPAGVKDQELNLGSLNLPKGKSVADIEITQGQCVLESLTLRAYPGKIEAEDFTSAYDNDPENQGKAYRPSETVDIQPCSEGGYNLGWVQDGEWLEYKVESRKEGTYGLKIRYASESGGGSIRLSLDGKPLGVFVAPATGGWQDWKDLEIQGLPLTPGTHGLRVEILKGGLNLDYLLFSQASP